MAIRLHGWLNDKFVGQLLLGNDWLHDKNNVKATGIKNEYTGAGDWRDLYHDNGSCLDIIHSSSSARDCLLQVAQADPLILTDGRSQVAARLDPACVRPFLRQHPHLSHPPAQAVLAVRDYTIRYTSYGPPRHRLQLILHTVDWLGIGSEQVSGAVALHQVDEVCAILEQLDHTRAAEDRRCLRPDMEAVAGTIVGEEEEDVEEDEEEGIMAPTMDESADLSQTQQPYTQVNFATQIDPAIPSRTSRSAPQVPGVNRVDTVMTGNMQREDMQASAYRNVQAKLLGLLKKTTGYVQPPDLDAQWNFQQPQSISSQPRSTTPTHPVETNVQRQPYSPREDRTHRTSSPPSIRRKKQATEVEARSPEIAEPSKAPQVIEEVSDRDSDDRMECSWMKDFVFNSESMVPDPRQITVLQKSSSWYKTQPGEIPFPENNIPIKLFTRICAIADENAAAQGQTQSDDEEVVDPSPDSDPEDTELLSSLESVPKVFHDDEPTTSQMSWSASPTPEPPQKPASIKHGLPPDSSLETEELAENTKIMQAVPAVMISPSREKEPSAPPSSPPVMEIPAESDDEMEMETSVPQALGEDTTEGAHMTSSHREFASSQFQQFMPVMQVLETPYAKSKHIYVSPRGREQTMNESSKNSSSASIVFGTHDNLASVGPAKEERGQAVTAHDDTVKPEVIDLSSGEEQGLADHIEPVAVTSPTSKDVTMLDLPSGTKPHREKTDRASVSGHSALSSQDPSRMSIPGSAKRKLADSPTKSSRRHSKRREIKIVEFGDDSPPSVDPILALRKDRADSLQRFRDTRLSSASFESRTGSATKINADTNLGLMEVVNSDTPPTMSPRHQSLYDEPSPPMPYLEADLRPLASPDTSHAIAQSQIPPMGSSSRLSVQATSVKVDKDVPPATEPSTIFAKFRATYPDYKGNEKHFKGQCLQMYQLDQEDKMVPKWQWDDFIIRNQIDYRTYVLDCVDNGEDHEPYHRFYKDTIRDTLYKKGIVSSSKTLLQALKELGAEPPVAPAEEPRQSKPSRTSLPSAFSKPKRPSGAPAPELPRQRPRHSLPVASHTNKRTSVPSSYTSTFHPPSTPASVRVSTSDPSDSKIPAPKPNLLSRLSVDPTPRVSRTPESTGDPFRDFYFAMQRAKSLTGSDTVDRSKPWPHNLEGRPTVADAPKRKIDVLAWNDVL